MIHIHHGKKAFGKTFILDEIELDVTCPGIIALVGESGCGKTTLLNIIAGFDVLSSGELTIDEKPAFIFQTYELIEELNVKDNIFLNHKELSEEEFSLLQELGLSSLLHNYPKELSGGQRQRVGIARALITHPRIICCDEPTESLDIDNKVIVMNLLKRLSKEAIVLVVTHDQKMIEEYADKIIRIKDKQLFVEKSYETENKISEKAKKHSIDVSWILNRILLYKSFIFTIIFTLLLGLWCGLYGYQQKMFMPSNTNQTLNSDMLYVKTDDIEKANMVLDISLENKDLIIDFINIRTKEKEYRSEIFPFVFSELEIKGKQPQNNEVIINQNVQKMLNVEVGDTMTLVYYIATTQQEMEVIVSGTVFESDSKFLGVYYNLNDMVEKLKDLFLPYGESFYSKFMETSNRYQVRVGYGNMESYFDELKQVRDIKASNLLYEERIAIAEQRAVYEMIYNVIMILYLVIILLFMILSLMKETKYQRRNCSILVSSGASFRTVKRQYIIKKAAFFYPFILVILSGLFFYLTIGFKEVLSLHHYVIMFGFVGSCCVLYMLVILVYTSQWSNKRISSSMKEE